VTVLGSLNMDISVTVPRLPGPGETVLGDAAAFTPGGKGANQAVAAARLGAQVRMVGCVGDDEFGETLLAALAADHVDTGQVRRVGQARTGLAMIAVDQAGENLITVAPGANHAVDATDVGQALAVGCDVLVISAEIPVPAIGEALRRASGAITLLNLAPAPPQAAALVADRPHWLVVNESEAAAVLGRPVAGLDDAARAAAELTARGARRAVVTAGAHGAALDQGKKVPGFAVEAVDTVGAGDAFVAALAVALAAGVPAAAAVTAAAAAGAAAATRPGAQAGMPRPADILAATGFTWPLAGNVSRQKGDYRPEESLE
jgi:ribokinase